MGRATSRWSLQGTALGGTGRPDLRCIRGAPATRAGASRPRALTSRHRLLQGRGLRTAQKSDGSDAPASRQGAVMRRVHSTGAGLRGREGPRATQGKGKREPRGRSIGVEVQGRPDGCGLPSGPAGPCVPGHEATDTQGHPNLRLLPHAGQQQHRTQYFLDGVHGRRSSFLDRVQSSRRGLEHLLLTLTGRPTPPACTQDSSSEEPCNAPRGEFAEHLVNTGLREP